MSHSTARPGVTRVTAEFAAPPKNGTMNSAHLHLVLNHAPVIGSIVVVLLLAVAFVRRSVDLQRVALIGAIGVGIITVAVYLTGEPAEEIVEPLLGVNKAAIDAHEAAAEAALIAISVAAVCSLGALVAFWRRPLAPKAAIASVLGLWMIAVGLVGWTANLGGKVRHTEIGASPAAASAEDDSH